MAMVHRGGRRYFYRSYRGPDGRVRREYAGAGEVADRAAAEVEGRKRERAAGRDRARRDGEVHAAAVAPLIAIDRLCRLLARVVLTARGFHRHDRGNWRKRRMNGPKSQTPETETPPKEYPAELRAVFERAMAGEESVLPDLGRAFDSHPEFVALFGDAVRQAEEALVRHATGTNLATAEAMRRHAAGRRGVLEGECTSDLERALAARLALCLLEADLVTVRAAELARGAGESPAAAAAGKRLTQAHARVLSAAKALAEVRRLLRPARSALDLLANPAAEGPVPGAVRNRLKDVPVRKATTN